MKVTASQSIVDNLASLADGEIDDLGGVLAMVAEALEGGIVIGLSPVEAIELHNDLRRVARVGNRRDTRTCVQERLLLLADAVWEAMGTPLDVERGEADD